MLTQKSTGTRVVFACFIALFTLTSASVQAQIEYLTATPLAKQISVSAGHVHSSGNIPLHVITWGGDIATIYTQTEGIFSQAGLRFELKAENNFRKQVEAFSMVNQNTVVAVNIFRRCESIFDERTMKQFTCRPPSFTLVKQSPRIGAEVALFSLPDTIGGVVVSISKKH